MRTCPACGQENADDLDFCGACGQYVRWEPTRKATALEEPLPAPAPTNGDGLPAPLPGPVLPRVDPTRQYPAARPDTVVVALRAKDSEGYGGEAATVQVEPGGRASMVALVRNQSGRVDNYDLHVEGFPDGWWTATPSTVYLVPFGASEAGYEQEVELALHPPRAAEAQAKAWSIRVVAISRASGVEAGSASGTVLVAPFAELESELRPTRAAGRRKATFAIAVRNRANAPIEVELTAADGEEALRFEFEKPQLVARPGRRTGSVFVVRPRKPIWIGRGVDRAFEVTPDAVGADAAGVVRRGVYRQRAWIPWWAPPAVALLAVGALAALLLMPHKTKVPDLSEAASLFAAQKLLSEQGLKLGAATERKTAKVKPGTILGQIPAAGGEVEEGTEVAVQVAIGTGTSKVPKVVGLTLQQADTLLKRAGFILGQARPEPTDLSRPISSQSPPAGELAPDGSAVNVFFAKPGAAKPRAGGEQPAGAKAAAKTLVVPTLAGLTGAALVDALADKGLTPVEVRRFDPEVPVDGLVATVPPAGTKVEPGAKVQVIVSNGFPSIAFDSGGDLFVAGGAAGKPVKAIAKSDEVEEQPAWSPDGSLIGFRRGPDFAQGRIWLADPEDAGSARPVTDEGFDDRRPAFSPDGKVLAFIRGPVAGEGEDVDHDLCFVRLGAQPSAPDCVADPETNVSRPTWSPDGKAILLRATQAHDPTQVELVEYTSATPSSGTASAWQTQGAVTDSMHGARQGDEVLSAAWSSDGKRVALTANWGVDFFHVVLVPVKEGTFAKPKALQKLRACEVAWRSDGGELAVVQRDAGCAGDGSIVRVDPARPEELVALTKVGAGNPAWSPASPGR